MIGVISFVVVVKSLNVNVIALIAVAKHMIVGVKT